MSTEAAPKFEDTEPIHSEEEAPPKFEDTAPHEDDPFAHMPALSQGETALSSLGHGASLGLSDVLSALMGTAGYRSGLDKPDDKSLADRYYDTKKQIQAQREQGEHSYPKTAALAELGGNLMLPLGALGTSVKGASKLANLGRTAALGAGIGGMYGLNASDSNLLGSDANPLQLAKDTGKSALGGAVLGPVVNALPNAAKVGVGLGAAGAAGLSALTGDDSTFKSALPLAMLTGAAIPAAANKISSMAEKSDSPLVQELMKAYHLEKSGIPLVGVKAKEGLETKINDTAANLRDSLLGGRKAGSNKIGDVLQKNENLPININPELAPHLEQALSLPAYTPQEIEDKKSILTTLQNLLFGAETKQSVVPGEFSVTPGAPVPSGEDAARQQLQTLQTKIDASQQAGAPEAQAMNSLQQKLAQRELTGGPAATDADITTTKASNDVKGITASIEPQGEEGDEGSSILTSLMKGGAKPGEIQTIVDPNTGKRTMGFLDPNGKLVSRPVSDVQAHTPVSIKQGPDKLVTTTDRNNMEEMLSPQELYNRIKSLQDMTAIGDNPVQTHEGMKLISDLQTALNEKLSGSLSLKDRAALEAGRAQMNKHLNAMEMLKIAPKGLVTLPPEQLAMENKLGSTIRGLDQEGATAQSRQNTLSKVIDQLQDVAPDLAAHIKGAVEPLGEQYDLARKMNRMGAGHSPESLLGTLKGETLKGAAMLGRGVGAIDNKLPKAAFKYGENVGQVVSPYAKSASDMAGSISAYVAKATPENIQALIPRVSAPYQKILSSISSIDTPEVTRRAVLFSLMQQPAFRESVGDLVGMTGTVLNQDKKAKEAVK